MATVIKAASIASPQPGDREPIDSEPGSTEPIGSKPGNTVPGDASGLPGLLAGRAAQDCLATAGLSPDAVGVLVNVGVYRESNMFEPAIGALVQKRAGINLDYLARPVPGAGFSFDLMNGACGVLNAVQVAQALLSTGSTERVLITAADVHPSGQGTQHADYPYADLGAALLLERSTEPGTGFGPVRLRNAGGASDAAGYLDTAAMGLEGRQQITVSRDAGWVERLLDLTAGLVAEYVREEGLDLTRTLLVCSRPTPDFASRLAERLGLDPSDVVNRPQDGEALPHTAAPVLGFLQAGTHPHEQLLFVTAGAGLSAACASYRPPVPVPDPGLAGAVRAQP
ncbi:hypothetical protein [Streptomyces sp. 7N604]|uniref:hypothetical protein n=1 Tax=Streptomyces sp. 7N604 TaxID=3457415 RepID=UPI003FD2DAFB